MKFKYKVQDRAGGIKEGVIDASDKYTLKNTLQSDGGVVLFVEEDSGRMKFDMESLNRVLARIKTQHLVVFAKNLSAMITAGLSLSRGLDILSRQTDNLKLKDVINELSADIGKGKSLSDGMHGHPKVFSSLFVSMVRVGDRFIKRNFFPSPRFLHDLFFFEYAKDLVHIDCFSKRLDLCF